ncbi:MAG TPA: hypothetical protein VFB66_20095 [Tepidisphaeraceae bacterium]|nr:hypothetical protein [Tepidisphaeraceae bacterium]
MSDWSTSRVYRVRTVSVLYWKFGPAPAVVPTSRLIASKSTGLSTKPPPVSSMLPSGW